MSPIPNFNGVPLGLVSLQRLIPYFLLLVAIVLTSLIYRPGLKGPFIFDDGVNVVDNQHLRIHEISLANLREAAFSIPNGVFYRPLSMLSFSINFYLDAGKITPFPEAFSFKLTNLIIHLLNGIALFALTQLLAGAYRRHRQPNLPSTYPRWLALATSAAWLLHPLNLTSVLYVVQRMTSLSALFVLGGLIAYVWGRGRLHAGRSGGMATIVVGMLVFTPLAMLSKENGMLLPFFMLVIELTLFKFETASIAARRGLIILFIVSTVLPAIFFILYVIQHPDWVLGGYLNRDFTLSERLMTEARVLWFYLRLILLPSIALMGMYHDDIVVSHQLLDPIQTFPAMLGILALPIFAWLWRRQQPLIAFGILFFFVGHSIESSFIGLELAHEHRNYLPMYGLLLVFFHLLLAPMQAESALLLRRCVAVLLIGLFAIGSFSRADSWATSFSLWRSEVEHHPDSVRTNLEMGNVYARYTSIAAENSEDKEVSYSLARHYYEQATSLKKSDVYGLFALIWLAGTHGKTVEEFWLDELTRRLSQETIPPDLNNQLVLLANCQLQPNCTLTKNQLERLQYAVLNNAKVVGRSRALIYSAVIYYHVNVTHDYPAAFDAVDRAIESAPLEFENRLWKVRILAAMQRAKEAREYFGLLAQYDRNQTHAQEIVLLGKELGFISYE